MSPNGMSQYGFSSPLDNQVRIFYFMRKKITFPLTKIFWVLTHGYGK